MKFLKIPLLQPVNAGWQGHTPTAGLRGRLSWRREKVAVLFTTWWIENAELTGGQNTKDTKNTTITTTRFLFAASGLWVLRTTQSDFVRLTWFLMILWWIRPRQSQYVSLWSHRNSHSKTLSLWASPPAPLSNRFSRPWHPKFNEWFGLVVWGPVLWIPRIPENERDWDS